jgi:hypothetical protein
LRTGPGHDVKLPPEKHRSSHVDLPAIVAPAASSRRTTVASRLGTKPSIDAEPLTIGTPATAMLSFTATVRPASGPSAVSVIAVRTDHALSGLSTGSDDSRTGTSGEDRS